MSKSNNELLFMFSIIFLLLAVFSPIIKNEFGSGGNEYDTDIIDKAVSGADSVGAVNVLDFISTIFFWVTDVPVLLSLFILAIRITYYVILIDKIRGIGS